MKWTSSIPILYFPHVGLQNLVSSISQRECDWVVGESLDGVENQDIKLWKWVKDIFTFKNKGRNSLTAQWLELSSFTVWCRVQSMVEKLRSHKSCGAAEKKERKKERNSQHGLREKQTSFLGRKKSGRLDVTFLWSRKTSLGGCLSYGSRRSVKKNLVSNHYLVASSGWEGRSLGPHGTHQAPLSSPPSFSVHGILHAILNTGMGCHFLLQGIFPT